MEQLTKNQAVATSQEAFFFKQKTAYEIGVRLVGSEMCIRDSTYSANATTARNPYLTRHFSRQNAVYCPFSKKERVFPDWSSLFGPFLVYFQIRNAIFVDFEERNTASVDVWVIFGSFSKE